MAFISKHGQFVIPSQSGYAIEYRIEWCAALQSMPTVHETK